jgi:hypothetical protein
MGDHCAARTRAACPVNTFGADDGVRFNGNRRKEKRSQRRDENCLHESKPSVVWRLAAPWAAESSQAMTFWGAIVLPHSTAGGGLLYSHELAVIDFADEKSAN